MDAISLTLLALALSLDSLTVGLLYGVRGIKLSWSAMMIVSFATGLLLALAMGSGRLLAAQLPPMAAQRTGASLLVAVGAWITYNTWRNSRREALVPESPPGLAPRRVWRLRLAALGIVIEILRQPGAADLDRSGHIGPWEACLLGVALAMDSVAAGLSAAMAGYSPYGLPAAAATGSFCLMLLGSRAGRILPIRLNGPWAALHGMVLVLLGLYRMAI